MTVGDAAVFIAGIAGSGKTRLGSLLSEHPNLSVTRKTYLWRNFYGRYGDLSDPGNAQRCLAALFDDPGVQRLGLDQSQLADDFAALPQNYEQLFALVHRSRAQQVGKARWCDQLGLVEAYAEVIFAAMPRAKMVHMVTDPRCGRLAARGSRSFGWTLGKWLTSVELAERNAAKFPHRYLVVRQEDLHAQEQATLREVLNFLDEPFPDSIVAERGGGSEPKTARESNCRFAESRARDVLINQGYEVNGRRAGSARYRLIDGPASHLGLAAWQHVRLPTLGRRTGASL